ncbi:MAG TPA: lycopene cyclase domain-containing protein [Pedobacter sp.]|jgi:lycopene cyclase domain-containing protein
MDRLYTYLLINILTVFFPVILSFDKKVAFYKHWKNIFPGLFITGSLFLVWDYIFTLYDVWSFNPDYVVGLYVLNLPIEEILFFITVPFACLFIYECLNHYVQKDLLKDVSTAISGFLVALSGIMLFLHSDRVYTLITFALLIIFSVWMLVKKPAYLSRFYLAYFVSLIPFYIVNGLLTSIPIVMYNDAQNIGIRIGTIPFEDHFYMLAMLLMNVWIFERFKSKVSR